MTTDADRSTIAIVDYGIGNLRSVEKALQHVGARAVVTADLVAIETAQGVVLPGVGAFGDGIARLRAGGFVPVLERLAATGRPILGICLGMQLLFEESEEMGRHTGLGLLRGRVRRFPAGLKVPHIGWNQVHIVQRDGMTTAGSMIPPLAATTVGLRGGETPPLQGIPQDAYAYFVHSYYVDPADEADILATTDYGLPYASVVGRGRLFGLQFHPEKSQDVGLQMLRNFIDLSGLRRARRMVDDPPAGH